MFVASLNAQTVKGTIVDENMEVLIGANIFWIESTVGTASDEMGTFEISGEGIEDQRLIITYLGYQNDTLIIDGDADFLVQMIPTNTLGEIVVEGKQSGGYISSTEAIKMEVVNEVELGKAACCDLAGCFNTNASVEPGTTNIITQSKELKILGLSGIYNQLLLDGFPLLQGLSYTYGVSSVPGPFVKTIFVAKGANSVLQGTESISGQINVILHPPVDAAPFYFNAFVNSFWEKQFNVYSAQQKGKFSNFIGGHLVLPASKFDRNDDTFLDLPRLNRYELLDKWIWGNDKENGWFNRGGIRWTKEKRTGGQEDYDPKTDLGSSTVYGQHVDYNQFDGWKRTSYRFNEFHATALILSGQYHDQDSWYGETNYRGKQYLMNAVLQHEFIYKNGSSLRGGLSYKYMDINETIEFSNNPLNKTFDGNYEFRERIPGIFAENTLFFLEDKFTWMIGLRTDHLNEFGWKISPRSLLKYTPKERTDIRLSAGYGWHNPKVFSEQSRVLSTQRDIHFHGRLRPDEAWNYGINLTQKFETNRISGTFTTDFYRTRFLNHVQAHYHQDHDAIDFSNNDKKAIGNGFQAEIILDMWDWVTLKNAYNFLDIRHTDLEGRKGTMDFITKHSFLTTFSLAPKGQDWHFDLTSHWYGKKKLPDTSFYPDDFRQSAYSIPYTIFNAQFTYKWKDFEWYAGCENILGFVQDDPIISAANPYNTYFDTSFAWGPTKGREGYLGIRYTLPKKQKESEE